ncbi:MAG: AMP nucleosidase [Elusimicrobia bacterium]|nr:AMP nucleosidase [Elusimicrobiota bacterium]
MKAAKLTQENLDDIDQHTRDRIGISTLERYTGSSASEFQPYVLLTNFKLYVRAFAEIQKTPVHKGSVMRACHSPKDGISIIDFSVGSPTAALVVDLLSFIKPKAVIMLGLCGGLREEYEVGDFFNPVAAIRNEGTSASYMPPQCPALSSFVLQRIACEELEKRRLKYHTGVIHTTNVRFWEFNEEFKASLAAERAQAIDMECATLFIVGYARRVPMGALMLISDVPLKKGGIKTADSAKKLFEKYTGLHIDIGIAALKTAQAREKAGGLDFRF